MKPDIAGLNQENLHGNENQPNHINGGMDVQNNGWRRSLMHIPHEIKPKSAQHCGPDDGHPDDVDVAIRSRQQRRSNHSSRHVFPGSITISSFYMGRRVPGSPGADTRRQRQKAFSRQQ